MFTTPPIALPPYSSAAVPEDPLSIERVEIVRGPAALLYGGNAIGGVVNTI
uniref:TonB-dependent receptor plug domain-containing protein n=1 Tax=Burkholderia multivorans TaxID=87883 RepID=UPI0035A23646